MKLTHAEIINLFTVLQKIKQVTTGKTRYAIARNIVLLSDAGRVIETVRKSLEGNESKEAEWQAFLQSNYEPESKINLKRLDFESCMIDENGLSPAELAVLIPLLDGCPE